MPITFDDSEQDRRLSELREKEEEAALQDEAAKRGLPYIQLALTPINGDALRLLTEEEARKARLVCFEVKAKKLSVALVAPENKETVAALELLRQKGFQPELYITSTKNLEHAWQSYKELSFASESKSGTFEITNETIAEYAGKIKSLVEIQKLINGILAANTTYRVSRFLEVVIAGALAINGSDIHFEPEETYARLRYRLDGVLNDVLNIDLPTFGLILSRIKLLSGLKLNVKTEAQDGRLSVSAGGAPIEIRTSVLPGAYAESLVLRILNPKSIAVPFEELGIPKKLLAVVQTEINKPQGMVLNTGPTGSGKTTTLYAFLKKVHSPGVKIITIEDPIEYHLPGIVQTQTKKDYGFVEGLRSALRQDPDIIMVGEIRDEETAKTAIDAALTGHLVFSTLHTNTAAGAFPRLIDLGVNPKIITSAISMVIAQRLVRKLCGNCKKETPLTGEPKKIIDRILGGLPDKSEIKNTAKVWRAVGCEACNGTGYRGRIGIFEAILTSQAIEDVVRNNPSEREIRKAASAQKIYDLKEDGVIKVLAGVTSFEELSRVVDLEEEI
jgi:type II secretory ATPase GspE/PulE/Tfp pilus assembly ATPase PilB-like protein